MIRHLPYLASSIATAAVGAIASAVFAAQAPPPAGVGASTVAPGQPIPAQPIAPNVVNQTYITPGFGVAQQVGTGGVPGTPSFTEGYGTTGPFGQTSMNQPGQPPFTEGFYGNQGAGGTLLNQPGVPDFYDGFGFNRGVVAPNQGANPVTPYPNYSVQVTPGFARTGGAFGFYNGFGGGQPDFGFYNGFTTPR